MDQNLYQIYKTRLKASRDYCEGNFYRSIDNYKHYLGRLDVGGISPDDYPFQSTMTLPISYEVIETVLPRYIGRDPEFTAVAVEPDDVPFEDTAKVTIDLEYNNPKLDLLGEPIYLKVYKGAKEGLITGNFVLRAFWRRQSKKRIQYLASLERSGHQNADVKTVMDTAKSLGAESEVTFSKKLVDSPFLDDFDVRHIPFFHFFPDSAFDMPGRMRQKIERDYMTFEEIEDEAEIFGYDETEMNALRELVQKKQGGFTPGETKDFLQQYQELFTNSLNPLVTSTDDDIVPLFIVDKMWMGDRLGVFVNEKVNLTGDKGIRNPYDLMVDPFIYGQDVVMPHSYFAWGEIDPIKKLEDGATDILNMRFDNLLQSMLNYWLYNPKFLTNSDEFVPIPNSTTAVGDINKAVAMISGKDVTASAYKEVEEMLNLVKRTSGTEDYVKGAEGESLAGRTYGGMRLVQEMANARFIVKSRLFEKLTLKSLGYFMLEMSRQFINKDRIRRITGETGDIEEKSIKAGDLKQIKGMFDIKVIPNSSMVIDQQAEAIKLNAVADRFVSQKGPFQNIPDAVYDRFLLKYLNAYGIHDAIYWIRAIRDNRAKLAKTPPPAETPPVNPLLPAPAPTGNEVLQSDQIAGNQPNPLESIINAESQLPTA